MARKKKETKVDLIKVDKVDIFKPLSLEDIGSNNDPCFGKEYDLSTKECKLCGDSELCAIAFAQSMRTTRKEMETASHYKDLDVLIDTKGIKKYIRTQKRNGDDKKTIIQKVMRKYEVTRDDARVLYKNTNNEKGS